MSRSIMRSSTQPTRPAELRTRYQSSITGLGGSLAFLWAATWGAFGAGCVGAAAGAADVCAAWLPAAGSFWSGRAAVALAFRAVLEATEDAVLGRFLSEVVRLRMSTFSPSLS